MDQKDVCESYNIYMVCTSRVRVPPHDHIFNIQGRAHAFTVQLCEPKKCKHVGDLYLWSLQSRAGGCLRRTRERANSASVFKQHNNEGRHWAMGRTMQVRDWARRAAQTVHVATSKALLKHVMNVDLVNTQNAESGQDRKARLLQPATC